MGKTTLGIKKNGDKVNLETSLRVGDELSGHFVYGHVDGVGEVVRVAQEPKQKTITIKPPKKMMRYIAPQGSVAIDGVSLTIAARTANTFTVALVAFTLAHTTLGLVKRGDKVNVEADMMMKKG